MRDQGSLDGAEAVKFLNPFLFIICYAGLARLERPLVFLCRGIIYQMNLNKTGSLIPVWRVLTLQIMEDIRAVKSIGPHKDYD